MSTAKSKKKPEGKNNKGQKDKTHLPDMLKMTKEYLTRLVDLSQLASDKLTKAAHKKMALVKEYLEKKQENKEGKQRYCSMRSLGLLKTPKLWLGKLECLGLMVSEALAQSIRNILSWPGHKLMHLLGRWDTQPNRKRVAVTSCALAVGIISYVVVGSFPNAYAVEMGGHDVAIVSEYCEVEEAVELFLAENSAFYSNIHYTDDISYRPVRAGKEAISSSEDVAALCESMNFVATAYKMFVDGEQVAVLQTREEGQELVSRVIDSYKPEVASGELKLTEVRIAEKIEYEKSEVDIRDFSDPQEFENYLLHGAEVQQTYTVKQNDTISEIASRFSLSADALRAANVRHQDENSYLQVGEVLNLNVVERPLHVVAKGVLTKKESIPFDTTYTNDATLWRGQHKTVESGKTGTKHVEYEVNFENGLEMACVEIGEQVVEAPSNKVVANGTKYMTASRGNGGNGQLAWPLRGRITSPYGSRRGGFHSGIDIGASSGTAVRAAGYGKVVGASWNGNYGRLVTIDHGNGLQTCYAHLSAFKVSYGDTVNKGDLIGLVGSTGRSTGPHLHFEVRINGSAKNPRGYLD